MSSSTTSIACLAKRSSLLLRKDVLAAGLSSAAITSLTRQGTLNRVGRGLYQLADTEAPNAELVEVSVRQPKGIIVLISALAFHGIGSHRASEIWLQLPINAPTPTSKWPPLRIIRSRLAAASRRLSRKAWRPTKSADIRCGLLRETVRLSIASNTAARWA